jgi:outer membrane protein
VDSLIRQAVRDHPKILAAQSQMKAAQAKINATRAEGLPKFSLIAADEYFNASATPH